MASPFQTQVALDLGNIFLNLNEFAESHSINGAAAVPCVIDVDDTKALRPGLGSYEGTFKETLTLFIRQADIPDPAPAYNQLINVDLTRYRIKDVDLVDGLYQLLLEAIK